MTSHLIRRIAVGTAALAVTLTVAGTGLAQAAPTLPHRLSSSAADSYQLTSSTVSIKPFSSKTWVGSCGDGYHVQGTWTPPDSYKRGWIFEPTIQVNGKWIQQDTEDGAQVTGDPIGTVAPNQTWQSLKVTLGNVSWIHSHDGDFSWTCDSN